METYKSRLTWRASLLTVTNSRESGVRVWHKATGETGLQLSPSNDLKGSKRFQVDQIKAFGAIEVKPPNPTSQRTYSRGNARKDVTSQPAPSPQEWKLKETKRFQLNQINHIGGIKPNTHDSASEGAHWRASGWNRGNLNPAPAPPNFKGTKSFHVDQINPSGGIMGEHPNSLSKANGGHVIGGKNYIEGPLFGQNQYHDPRSNTPRFLRLANGDVIPDTRGRPKFTNQQSPPNQNMKNFQNQNSLPLRQLGQFKPPKFSSNRNGRVLQQQPEAMKNTYQNWQESSHWPLNPAAQPFTPQKAADEIPQFVRVPPPNQGVNWFHPQDTSAYTKYILAKPRTYLAEPSAEPGRYNLPTDEAFAKSLIDNKDHRIAEHQPEELAV